jgi:hypothetical protein
MAYAIWTVGAVSAIALAGVTLYLVFLNWNSELGGTLLSVVLGGAVALFIAVFSQLKETSVARRFIVEIPFDTSTGFPQSPIGTPPNDASELARFLWLSRLHSIAVQPHFPTIQPGQSATVDLRTKAKAVSDEEMFVACSQLLQYKLLEDIRDNQAVSGARPPVVDGHEIPSVQAPELVAAVEDYPSASVQALLTTNRYNSPNPMLWENRTLRVPARARIQVRPVPSSEATGVRKDLIIVERPNYFRSVITIEALGAGGVGRSPIKNVRLAVSMRATMFKLTAGSSYSADAKAWSEWLFRMLEEANT